MQYAADMKAGRWQLNGEAIKFDKNGHLLNGQHRLHAVVRADTTIQMLVISGLDPETRTTMDSGLVAKNWDWSEIPYGREVSSICASIVLMRFPTLGRALSRTEMELTYQMLGPDLIQYVVRRMRPGIAARAPLRAGAVLLHRAEKEGFAEDSIAVRTGDYIERVVHLAAPMNSPESALFRSFGAGSHSGRRHFRDDQQRAMVARAVVAALRGEEVKLLRKCPEDQLVWLFDKAKITFPEGVVAAPSEAEPEADATE